MEVLFQELNYFDRNTTCCICLDRLKDAASSACCHVFCNLCIASLFGQKQKKQKCPICNGAITRRSFYKRPHIQKISDKFVEILAAMEKDGIKTDKIADFCPDRNTGSELLTKNMNEKKKIQVYKDPVIKEEKGGKFHANIGFPIKSKQKAKRDYSRQKDVSEDSQFLSVSQRYEPVYSFGTLKEAKKIDLGSSPAAKEKVSDWLESIDEKNASPLTMIEEIEESEPRPKQTEKQGDRKVKNKSGNTFEKTHTNGESSSRKFFKGERPQRYRINTFPGTPMRSQLGKKPRYMTVSHDNIKFDNPYDFLPSQDSDLVTAKQKKGKPWASRRKKPPKSPSPDLDDFDKLFAEELNGNAKESNVIKESPEDIKAPTSPVIELFSSQPKIEELDDIKTDRQKISKAKASSKKAEPRQTKQRVTRSKSKKEAETLIEDDLNLENLFANEEHVIVESRVVATTSKSGVIPPEINDSPQIEESRDVSRKSFNGKLVKNMGKFKPPEPFSAEKAESLVSVLKGPGSEREVCKKKVMFQHPTEIALYDVQSSNESSVLQSLTTQKGEERTSVVEELQLNPITTTPEKVVVPSPQPVALLNRCFTSPIKNGNKVGQLPKSPGWSRIEGLKEDLDKRQRTVKLDVTITSNAVREPENKEADYICSSFDDIQAVDIPKMGSKLQEFMVLSNHNENSPTRSIPFSPKKQTSYFNTPELPKRATFKIQAETQELSAISSKESTQDLFVEMIKKKEQLQTRPPLRVKDPLLPFPSGKKIRIVPKPSSSFSIEKVAENISTAATEILESEGTTTVIANSEETTHPSSEGNESGCHSHPHTRNVEIQVTQSLYANVEPNLINEEQSVPVEFQRVPFFRRGAIRTPPKSPEVRRTIAFLLKGKLSNSDAQHTWFRSSNLGHHAPLPSEESLNDNTVVSLLVQQGREHPISPISKVEKDMGILFGESDPPLAIGVAEDNVHNRVIELQSDDVVTSSQSPAKRLKRDDNVATVSNISLSSPENRKVSEEIGSNIANEETDNLGKALISSESKSGTIPRLSRLRLASAKSEEESPFELESESLDLETQSDLCNEHQIIMLDDADVCRENIEKRHLKESCIPVTKSDVENACTPVHGTIPIYEDNKDLFADDEQRALKIDSQGLVETLVNIESREARKFERTTMLKKYSPTKSRLRVTDKPTVVADRFENYQENLTSNEQVVGTVTPKRNIEIPPSPLKSVENINTFDTPRSRGKLTLSKERDHKPHRNLSKGHILSEKPNSSKDKMFGISLENYNSLVEGMPSPLKVEGIQALSTPKLLKSGGVTKQRTNYEQKNILMNSDSVSTLAPNTVGVLPLDERMNTNNTHLSINPSFPVPEIPQVLETQSSLSCVPSYLLDRTFYSDADEAVYTSPEGRKRSSTEFDGPSVDGKRSKVEEMETQDSFDEIAANMADDLLTVHEKDVVNLEEKANTQKFVKTPVEKFEQDPKKSKVEMNDGDEIFGSSQEKSPKSLLRGQTILSSTSKLSGKSPGRSPIVSQIRLSSTPNGDKTKSTSLTRSTQVFIQPGYIETKSIVSVDHTKVLTTTGISARSKSLVKTFCDKFDFVNRSTYTDEITHVICATDNRGNFVKTLKYLKGLAHKKAVLPIEWISKSLEAEKLLEEELFQTESIRKVKEHGCDVFQGCTFHILGPTNEVSKEDLEDIICSCGGTTVENLNELKPFGTRQAVIMEMDESQKYVELIRDLTEKGILFIGREWIVECVSHLRLYNFGSYLLDYPENVSKVLEMTGWRADLVDGCLSYIETQNCDE
ncbi:breast cancer type 1 susceptibility protein-like [Artemia franciscana]|uniref:RING-type E3 ubiquitin transferase BRCA1 n=1 Tax=Artemia franciscana TaxID=6661 RepID=A0AA88HMV0_ARTSF|nr:hypothetical protein QYM36_012788 [Artemia franciscana]